MAQPVKPAQQAAPVRTYIYDIGVGATSYRVVLQAPHPTGRDGRVDPVAAERRLHDLLLNNELVGSGGTPVRADVTIPGRPRFNGGTLNQRLDLFRDSYLSRTFREGEFVHSRDVRIAEATPVTAPPKRMVR